MWIFLSITNVIGNLYFVFKIVTDTRFKLEMKTRNRNGPSYPWENVLWVGEHCYYEMCCMRTEKYRLCSLYQFISQLYGRGAPNQRKPCESSFFFLFFFFSFYLFMRIGFLDSVLPVHIFSVDVSYCLGGRQLREHLDTPAEPRGARRAKVQV